ncbi:MAG TPA: amino acid ABC transporter permease [Candidatus Aquabacterium excrementipullorum]|nr:amino acid ABC transporter permease [Candidatus Aquabacterium excrementipullorum]
MSTTRASNTNASPRAWLWQAPVLLLLAWLLWHVLDWAVLKAVFLPDLEACRALEHHGACWGVVTEKWRWWLFGRYPVEHHARPALTLLLWAAALAALIVPAWRGRLGTRAGLWSCAASLVLWLLGLAILAGGWAGLPSVESRLWGGLPLTVLLTVVSLGLSLPLAVVLAWARLSARAWVSWPAVAVIEVIRGGPLVMWLFMAAFLLPAVLPASWGVGPVGRVLIVTVLFSGAYAAETLRGSLRVVAGEQAEATQVLGASWWASQRLVILPQAFRTALPSLVNHSIGVLKDTSLVMIVSLQELTGAMSVSLNGDADWRPFFLEAYLVIAVVYVLMCQGVSVTGRWLEKQYPALGYRQ